MPGIILGDGKCILKGIGYLGLKNTERDIKITKERRKIDMLEQVKGDLQARQELTILQNVNRN